MRLILLGAPGAGKGTQAQLLAQGLKIPHISTGDLFRRAISERSELGLKAKEFMDRGELVPDRIVIDMVAELLASPEYSDGFILDGFPRTVEQAEALAALLEDLGRPLTGVVNIVVPADELVTRLAGRRTCASCAASYHVKFNPPRVPGVCDRCQGELVQRADDAEETVRNRLAVYEHQTKPLVDFYRQRGLLREVDGQGSVEDVNERIRRAIGGQA